MGLLSSAASAANRIYWANAGGAPSSELSFGMLDQSGGADLSTAGAPAACCPFGVAIDAAAGRIYWGTDDNTRIAFANLDGSGGGGELNVTGATLSTDGTGALGVAIDPVGGRIYWTNHHLNRISFARLDGTGGGDLSTSGATVDGPQGLALDVAAGRLYWANGGGVISYANLNGSRGGDLNTTAATASEPYGVALDVAAGRIYWADYLGSRISFARLDGTGGEDLTITGTTVTNPLGVAIDVDAGRIYWANYNANRISSANLDGSGGVDLNTSGTTIAAPNFPALLRAPSGSGAPAISGGSVPGSVLTCPQGSWAPDLLGAFLYRAPTSFAFSWSRDGAEVAAASASSLQASTPGDYRCTVTASNLAGSAAQTSAPHSIVLASLRRFAIKPGAFLPAPRGPSVRGSRRAKPGARVSFRLNEAASVRFRVKRRGPGRRLVVLRGGFRRAGNGGANSFRFTGRLRGRELKPGRYFLVATPKAGDTAGRARRASFRVKSR
jgi:low density lipoprotein receptor-related protein 5/6